MVKKLAIEGGRPVRKTRLVGSFSGAASLGKEELNAVVKVMKGKSLFRSYGKKENPPHVVRDFEKAFARKMGTKYALGVTSGTAALHVGLEAIGVGPGDEVIVPAITFIASIGAVVVSRAIPVFAEIDKSYMLDPKDVEARITRKTKAIMPVHIVGVAAKMDELKRIARKHRLKIIEDCAQSCGASYKGRRVGAIGDVGCYSLQYQKVITTGDGGAVATNNAETYERAIRYHDQGGVRPEFGLETKCVPFFGECFRMNEMTGAVALAQLKKLDGLIRLMRSAKRRIKQGISDIEGIEFREIPDPEGDAGVSLIFFLPDAKVRAKFVEAVNAEGIGVFRAMEKYAAYADDRVLKRSTVTKEGCPFTCPYYGKKVEYTIGMCPTTEALIKRAVYICPIDPFFTRKDCDDIVEAIQKVARVML